MSRNNNICTRFCIDLLIVSLSSETHLLVWNSIKPEAMPHPSHLDPHHQHPTHVIVLPPQPLETDASPKGCCPAGCGSALSSSSSAPASTGPSLAAFPSHCHHSRLSPTLRLNPENPSVRSVSRVLLGMDSPMIDRRQDSRPHRRPCRVKRCVPSSFHTVHAFPWFCLPSAVAAACSEQHWFPHSLPWASAGRHFVAALAVN